MTDIIPDTMTPLVRDLLEWLGRQPRTHAEVIATWGTSCPRLPVWEEATDRRLVVRKGAMVEITPQGRSFLALQHP
jgi:hypothetical protein